MQNRVTELLNIKYPIIQGGMAWVAEHNLAAAVSNAGGLGIIAGGGAPADIIRDEIRKCKAICDKPFGVNIMLMSPFAAEIAEVVIEEGVKVVTTGAGSPGKYIEKWKEAGIIVIPVVPSVAYAVRMERMGADAVVAEGCEAGGHIGETTTMALTSQVVNAVKIPVIAAGGIADGKTMAAAFMLGAEAVQCGTVFIPTTECIVHENYKNLVIESKDTSTAVTGRSTGHPVRSIRTPLTKKCIEMENNNATLEEMEQFTVGSLRKAVQDGDSKCGSFMAGQIAGLVNEIRPCTDVINSMVKEMKETISKAQNLF